MINILAVSKFRFFVHHFKDLPALGTPFIRALNLTFNLAGSTRTVILSSSNTDSTPLPVRTSTRCTKDVDVLRRGSNGTLHVGDR